MKRIIKRRDFLKQIGCLLSGIMVFRLKNIFSFFGNQRKDGTSPKEAKYYTQADDLLG